MSKRGKPRRWESAEQFEELVEGYFKECDKKDLPYTVIGMCAHLGTNRQTLNEYYNSVDCKGNKTDKGDGFKEIIDWAKGKIEAQMCERMLMGSNNPTASIFLLKVHYGYDDKSKEVTQMQNQMNAMLNTQAMLANMINSPVKNRTEKDIND